jgi:hypothetical protein
VGSRCLNLRKLPQATAISSKVTRTRSPSAPASGDPHPAASEVSATGAGSWASASGDTGDRAAGGCLALPPARPDTGGAAATGSGSPASGPKSSPSESVKMPARTSPPSSSSCMGWWESGGGGGGMCVRVRQGGPYPTVSRLQPNGRPTLATPTTPARQCGTIPRALRMRGKPIAVQKTMVLLSGATTHSKHPALPATKCKHHCLCATGTIGDGVRTG